MGRLRLCAARRLVPGHPRALLPRHHSGPGAYQQGARLPRRRTRAAEPGLERALHGPRRDRPDLAHRRRHADLWAQAEDQDHRRAAAAAASGAADVHPRRVAASLRLDRVPRPAAGVACERPASGDQPGRPRGVSLRRRAVGDAEGLAARSAQGAGRRRALVRARGPQDRILVRPLPGHAQPGLPRDRPRGAFRDGGSPGHRGPSRALRWESGDDVLLLELGRSHRVCSRGVPQRSRHPVPGLGQRSVRHDFAAPSLGAIRRLGPAPAPDARRARGALRRHARRSGPRDESRRSPESARRASRR